MANHVLEMPAIHLTLELGSSQGTWGVAPRSSGPPLRRTSPARSLGTSSPSNTLSPQLCRLHNAISLFPSSHPDPVLLPKTPQLFSWGCPPPQDSV